MTNVLMNIFIIDKIHFVPTFQSAFFKILVTKLNYQITVAFESFVPYHPNILLNCIPLWIVPVILLFDYLKLNLRFFHLNNFSVCDVGF